MSRAITAFVRRVGWRRRLAHALLWTTAHGVLAGLAVWLGHWLWPQHLRTLLVAAATWVSLAALWAVARRGLSVPAADRSFLLGDRLITWWGMQRRPSTPSIRWLAEDLEHALATIPAARQRETWWRPLRRALWLLPLLLLVWWIGPLGRGGLMRSHAPAVAGDRGAPQTPQPTDGGSRPQGVRPSESGPRSPGAPPPRPIPDLPAQNEFVIPRLIDDGRGKTKRVRVAEVEQDAPGSKPPPTPAERGAGAEPAVRPPELDFVAAAERALRARNVPPVERPFVRSYFTALQECSRTP